jgi:pantoate kinase
VKADAFAPGHLTSFFSIFGSPNQRPDQRGSRGAGFCIESGVHAQASALGPRVKPPAAKTSALPFDLKVIDNGVPVPDPRATTAALEDLVRRAGRHGSFREFLRIENRYSLPLGAGFGVSGACALTATLVANETLGLGLDRSECVGAAHFGEVDALTGLGDVGPQSLGGFEVRTREGPPPLGEIQVFESPAREVVLTSFGPRDTRVFLSDPEGKQRLNAAGHRCLEKLLESPTLEHCVRLGRAFAETLGLVSPRASAVLRTLDAAGVASVAMLGDSVYAIGQDRLGEVAKSASAGAYFEVTRVAREGARLL